MEYRALKSYIKKPSKFSLKEIRPNIYFLNFKSKKDMCLTLLRFQEYYESKYFRNKKFSLKEFYDHYVNLNGSFSYHKDWLGFNFPSSVFNHFEGLSDLSPKEKEIIKLFKDKKCYVIATVGTSADVLNHEIAHAYYFLNSSYKKNTKKILNNKNLKKIYNLLDSLGYHKAVFFDEAQAYLCWNANYLKKNKVIKNNFKKEISQLKLNYKKLHT